jgi:carbamoylphosphate synthase small subunit
MNSQMLEDAIKSIIREVVRDELREWTSPRLPDHLLSADEVARILGFDDRQSIYRLRREGHLKAVWVSEKEFKFTPEVVQAFIARGGVKGSAASDDVAEAA